MAAGRTNAQVIAVALDGPLPAVGLGFSNAISVAGFTVFDLSVALMSYILARVLFRRVSALE